LQHFGKIGPGDIVQLEVEIEKEKREKEKEAEAEAAAAMKVDSVAQNGNGNEEQTAPGLSEVNGSGATRMRRLGLRCGQTGMLTWRASEFVFFVCLGLLHSSNRDSMNGIGTKRMASVSSACVRFTLVYST
jgi:hypothetical protein